MPRLDDSEAGMDLSLQAFAMEFDNPLERPITVWDQPLESEERFGRQLSSNAARCQPNDAWQTKPEPHEKCDNANEESLRQCRLRRPARRPGKMQALFGRLHRSAVSLFPWKPSQKKDATCWSSRDEHSLSEMSSHRFEEKQCASARPAACKDRKRVERRECCVAGTPAK